MKIEPLDGIVYLNIEEAKAGVLDTSSRQSAVEYAEVIAVPEHDCCDDVKKCSHWKIHKGDHIFVKAWGIDIIQYQDKKYYFVNINNGSILAVVK